MPTRQRSVSRVSKISYNDLLELDNTLENLKLRRHSVPNDGDSFYSAVSHQLSLLGRNVKPLSIRRKCVEYLQRNDKIGDCSWIRAVDTGETKDAYLFRHSKTGEMADDIMVQAAAAALRYVIMVVTVGETIKVEPYSNPMGEIMVARVNGENYISLEGNVKMEEGRLPLLFNLQDNISPRGILKQKQIDGRNAGPKNTGNNDHPNLYENEKSEKEGEEKKDSIGMPGLNPIDSNFPDDLMLSDEEQVPLMQVPAYDQFICEPPEDDQRTATATMKFFTKTFKFVSYFVFGGILIAGALASKGSLMVLVNSAKPYQPDEDASEADKLDHDVLRMWSYIVLMTMMLIPEALTVIYSLYRIIMKAEKKADMSTYLWGLLWEVLHAFGESILILKVFPYLDATYVLLLMPLIAIIPICVHIHAKYHSVMDNKRKAQYQASMQYKRKRNLFMAFLALVLQLAGIVSLFAGFFSNSGSCYGGTTCGSDSYWFCFLCPSYTYIWACVGLVLTSLRYWENFVSSSFYLTKNLKIRARKLHKNLDNARFQTGFVFSLVKCFIVVGMTFLVGVVLENDSYTSDHVLHNANGELDPYTGTRFSRISNLLSYGGRRSKNRGPILQQLWYVLAVQTCGSFAAFFMGRVACLTMIQPHSFSFPLALVTPIIAAVSAALGVFKQTGKGSGLLNFLGIAEQYKKIKGLGYYIDWNNKLFFPSPISPSATVGVQTPYSTEMAAVMVVVGLILGYLGILLITHYLWQNPFNRLERMEVLFVKPLYGGIMVDQTMLLNRRQYEQEYSNYRMKKDQEEEKKRQEREERERNSSSNRSVRRRKSSRRATIARGHKFVPQLFLCATMWHETESEMTQILTSLMRLDKDQGSRRINAQDDDDYYNFQVHILFDDAMERSKDGIETKTNKYVHQLCSLIPLAANKVELGKGYDLPHPVIYPTPYGGRLEFVMPHGNLLVVHLKDKEKIRHRKRWSQCMYMYYILGFLQASKKAYKLEDVFLLALDGDVDFQPNAVLLLLDRMKRNPDVGAACGRIHPTGSGPVVWFQKFEYAVGHWLQKTAEHVLGCVLCSPGCFSLFRGSALVDVNVVKQYTTRATEARHYVQWDQGEDRWLCTLLLKQGWRIEYSAASDSYTFAPEDFKEFYNQRRRWGPSTMANIFDILLDAKLAVKNNIYISWGYIAYQLGLMISSLLGPATVIMIVQGAYQYVFQWSATLALIVSLIPVIIFIILCYTTSADTQVAVAAILTVLYALVMMAVVVGVIGTMVTNVFLDPNNLFMFILVGMYAFTGILHPQEIMCLLHGILYYLCVPSAFIFLMVYSLTNMNNVSWGTREVKKPAGSGESASEVALEEVANKNGKKKNIQIGPGSVYDAPTSADGYYSCGLGNLCQCALCIQPQNVHVPAQTQVVRRQPSRRFTHAGQRRYTTAGQHRHSMYKRFSMAKARQVTGTENEEVGSEIEHRLGQRMSVAQLRRISTRLGPDSMTTAKLRRLSSHQRRFSKRSNEPMDPNAPSHPMSEDAQLLSQELAHEQEMQFENVSNDGSIYDDAVDEERLLDEEEELLYWVMDGPLQDGVIEYLDDEEREFWKYLIQHYLYPLDEDKDEKARIKSNLKKLRNEVTGAYFMLNALWLILNFALQLTITDIAIVFFVNGARISVNPVSFAFLLFFLIILVIQFTCMVIHRWSTAMHLLSVTSLKWRDNREGIKSVKNKDLAKAEMLQKFKKKKKTPNGHAFGVDDPLDREATTGTNFSFGERNSSSGYDNVGFAATEEDNSVNESDSVETLYEKIDTSRRFDNNPANRMFGSVNKNYINVDGPAVRKTSANIDLTIFNETKKSSKKDEETARREAKKSVFSDPAVDDLIEKQIQAQVHHQDPTAPKTKSHAGVRFGPLPTETEEIDEMNTAC